MASTTTNKRKALSLTVRMDVVKRLDSNESQASIAKSYGVHPSSISRIMKQKDQVIEDWQNNTNPDRKRKRTGKAEDVEEVLLRWFTLQSYLEAAGCDNYEHFYRLTDQLYATSKQQAVQKTMKDFFK